MSPSPTAKVLSRLRRAKVRALLMGGQACILYGGAEFTRDIDIAVADTPDNLRRLGAVLREFRAETIYFPPLSASALRRGHACHFRCLAPGLRRVRLDVMARMRGADGFSRLWRRRVALALPGVGTIALMSLPDLVCIKKTQRDKDWPMVRRLVEADILAGGPNPKPDRIRFWLAECRTAEWLVRLARNHRKIAAKSAGRRGILRAAFRGDVERVAALLREEEDDERRKDRRYWAPLKAELERWRMERNR